MKSKASQRNMLVRIISTPSRALRKARDYYVKSMTNYANNYGNVMAAGPSQAALPRSFSASSARTYENEDFRELLRVSSSRQTDNRTDLNFYVPQMKVKSSSRGDPRAMPRSSSVAMGRIDEESPCCHFGEDKYSRSRSHAVTGGRLSAF